LSVPGSVGNGRAVPYKKGRQLDEDHSARLLTARKADVQVMQFGLAWVPPWRPV
jgi:hypothetical protein